jgi:hypothetical protein
MALQDSSRHRPPLELRRFGLPRPASVFRVWLVSSLARLGRFDEAAVQAERACASRARPISRWS